MGLAVAEALQEAKVHVIATQMCASSCANYLFAGVRNRHALGQPAILFHGGYSSQSKALAMANVDALLKGAARNLIANPEQEKAKISLQFDELRRRQAALYARVGVSESVVTGVDSLDLGKLPADVCGRAGLPRNFVYFGDDQLKSLGLVLRSGKTASSAEMVDRRLREVRAGFTACRAPAGYGHRPS